MFATKLCKLGFIGLAGALLVSGLAACGGSAIRVVQQSPSGGAVALQAASDGAREKAEEYMGAQCPFGYDILAQHPSDGNPDEQTIRYACRAENSGEGDDGKTPAREVAIKI